MNEPIDLFLHLRNLDFKYGWTTKDGRTILPEDKEFGDEDFYNEHCQILKPKEFKYRKIGTSSELVLFECEQLNKMGYRAVPVHLTSLKRNHSFVIFENPKTFRCYWFEWCWEEFRGINGPQINKFRLFDWIKEQINYSGIIVNQIKVVDENDFKILLEKEIITPQNFLKIFRQIRK